MAKPSTKQRQYKFAREVKVAVEQVSENRHILLILFAAILANWLKLKRLVTDFAADLSRAVRSFPQYTDRRPAMPPHLWGEERAAGGGGGGGRRPEGSEYYIELFWVKWPFIPYMHRVALDHPRTQAETIVSSLLSMCGAMVYMSFLGGYMLYLAASGLLGYMSYAFAYYGDWQRALIAISGAVVLASLVYVSAWYMTRPPAPARARAG